jgi:hypothetical protein
MPTPWLKRIRETGQLTVFNKGGMWADSVNAAIKTFNTLPFENIELVAEKDEKSANVVVILANGPTQYKRDGYTTQPGPKFKADQFTGDTRTLIDTRLNAIFFAAIFLPGKLPKPAKGQKEVMIVHELIHACGVPEHEGTGIMYDTMVPSNGGLKEGGGEQAEAMPPIRVGSLTLSRVESVWMSPQAYAAWLQRPDI